MTDTPPNTPSPRLECYAVCALGLEDLLRTELIALGLSPNAVEEPGGVSFPTDLAGLYRANLNVRSASRILVRMGAFYAHEYEQLSYNAARLPWKRYLNPDRPVRLRVTCRKSRLNIDDAVARALSEALRERFGRPVEVIKHDEDFETPAQLITARLLQDRCTISLDSSGALLHRRGYRLAVAKAPLRETLAAAALMLAGWNPEMPMIDPFCGSGTIPIEAALMARRIAPGKNRRFAFMEWLNYDQAAWKTQLEEARQLELPAAPAPILGSDRDAGAIKISAANAERAGVERDIVFTCQAVSHLAPPPSRSGWVITNPPYGLRTSPADDLRNLYARLGQILRLSLSGWKAAVFCPDDVLLGQMETRFSRKILLENGGIQVKLAVT